MLINHVAFRHWD